MRHPGPVPGKGALGTRRRYNASHLQTRCWNYDVEPRDREGLLKPTRRAGYASRRLSLSRVGKVKIWKMACRAEVRTGYGKSVRPESQGGFRKRDLWWN
jgi:hypothetical protein